MASTKADNNRVAWKYTMNNGTTEYRVSAKNVYVNDGTDGAKYGGSSAAGTVPRLPRGFRMRAFKATSASGVAIWITGYTAACTLATAGTTVTRNLNGTDTVFTTTGDVREEKAPRPGITQTS